MRISDWSSDVCSSDLTVEDFNRYADAGKDPDFARGENYYSAYMGDALHKPNPALGALRKAPFYALQVRPSDLSSLAGLDTSARAQVLGTEIGRATCRERVCTDV